MKQWHVATRSKRRERIDTFAPARLTAAFALGFFADKLHLTSPTFTHWLRWGLYMGLIGPGFM
jgi:predicted Kef-type K+ transport protein